MAKKKKTNGVEWQGVGNQILQKAGCIEIKSKRIETSPTILIIIRHIIKHGSQFKEKLYWILKIQI